MVGVLVGVFVGVAELVGVGVDVCVGDGVSVAVPVGVGVNVGVMVLVGVGVLVAVGVGVGVGVVGSGNTNSTAPMSQTGPCGRRIPRWSVGGQPALSPPSIAGLPGKSMCVSVWPPLSASGPNSGLVLIRSPMAFRPQLLLLSRLCPPERGG